MAYFGPGMYWLLYLGVTCVIILVIVNIISAILLILLGRHEEASTFFLVQLILLIYLDCVWIMTGIVNPGIIRHDEGTDYPCPICENPNLNNVMLQEHTHCKHCQICIEDRDHHCAMTGGCIGHGNRFLYYFFMLGAFMWSIDVISSIPFLYYLSK